VRLLEQFVNPRKAVAARKLLRTSVALSRAEVFDYPGHGTCLRIVATKFGVTEEALGPLASAAPKSGVESTLLDAAKLKAAGAPSRSSNGWPHSACDRDAATRMDL